MSKADFTKEDHYQGWNACRR